MKCQKLPNQPPCQNLASNIWNLTKYSTSRMKKISLMNPIPYAHSIACCPTTKSIWSKLHLLECQAISTLKAWEQSANKCSKGWYNVPVLWEEAVMSSRNVITGMSGWLMPRSIWIRICSGWWSSKDWCTSRKTTDSWQGRKFVRLWSPLKKNLLTLIEWSPSQPQKYFFFFWCSSTSDA